MRRVPVGRGRTQRVRALTGVVAVLCGGLVALAGSDGAAGAGSNPSRGFSVFSVACPTGSRCVATGVALLDERTVSPFVMQVLTFKPTSSGKVTPQPLVANTSVNGLDCPTSSRCVGVGEQLSKSHQTGTGSAVAVVFDPASPDHPKQFDLDGAKTTSAAVSCSSSARCTAIVAHRELQSYDFVTFNPATAAVGQPFKLSGTNQRPTSSFWNSLSCPSASQCTAVGLGGEVTFDPASGAVNAAGPKALASRPFPPQRPGGEPTSEDAQLSGVVCPSVSQCTTRGGYGGDEGGPQTSVEVTFDPTSGTVNSAGAKTLATGDDSGGYLACPTIGRCTADAGSSTQKTFDPSTGDVIHEMDSVGALATCTPSLCEAFDRHSRGQISAFNPLTGKVTDKLTVDLNAATQIPKLETALKRCKRIANRKKRAACVKKANHRFG
jgi:hypothetical protein